MARYYFNVRDEHSVASDDEGSDWPDFDAAKHEAVESALDLLAEAVKSRETVFGKSVEITDEHGVIIEVIVIRELLK